MNGFDEDTEDPVFDAFELVDWALRFEQAHAAGRMDSGDREYADSGGQKEELQTVAECIRRFISDKRITDTGLLSAAYFALSKRCDPDDIPFLRERLKVEMDRDMGVCYQVMIALENLGEGVFAPERNHYSSLDSELNRADAIGYLNSF